MTVTGQAPALQPQGGTLPGARTPMAHLLHALNQPLTGLQCSLELAVAGPRPQDQYVRTLRDGLELACRMRLLVEAMRELAEAQRPAEEEDASVRLDTVLVDVVEELKPVAATRNVRLKLDGTTALPVRAGMRRIRELVFRILDSVVSLAREASDLEVSATRVKERSVLALGWHPASLPPAYSPFSAPELGLLIAQAGWEQLGGYWSHLEKENGQALTLQLPLAESSAALSSSSAHDRLCHGGSGCGLRGDAQ